MSNRRIKTESCLICNVNFLQADGTDLYHAKDRCSSCYSKLIYERKQLLKSPKKINLGYCYKCKAEWGSINNKGREIKIFSGQLCSSCYNLEYKSNRTKICLICNEIILNKTTRNVCKRCFVPVKVKLSKKKEAELKKLTYAKEELEKLRLLLVRFNRNMNTYVDYYILVDLYMTLVCNEVHISKYENIDVKAQIVYMLKDLTELYDNHKIKRKENV